MDTLHKTDLQEQERIEVLESLAKVDYPSKRILGQTVNYIMTDQVQSIESLSRILFVMNILRY